MGFRLKYYIKSKAQSSESIWILLYKSSVLFETQLYMNLSSCIMFENCGELTVAMFSSNPANCPLVSELKQGYQFWKTLWSITSKQWEDKDDFTHVIKARHFWVDPWFEELSLLTMTPLKDFAINYQAQQSTAHGRSCTCTGGLHHYCCVFIPDSSDLQQHQLKGSNEV